MRILRFNIIVFTLFIFSNVKAQGVVELLCRVVDQETKFPISYATIQFNDSNNGVIANVDGDFRIPFELKSNKETIIISSIGYETLNVELEILSNKSINIIELKPKIEVLDAVVIKSTKKNRSNTDIINPYTIVKTAISKIPQNYPNQNHSKLGYYRDYQIVNNKYYNLNEAIIEAYDAGFDTDIIMDANNQNVLYRYEENNEFLRDSLLLMPYDGNNKYIENTELSGQGGNELGILNIHNPIRNYEYLSFSFVYIFSKKFLDNHTFTNIKKVYLNDEIIYEISFEADKKLTKGSHNAKGKIYIAKSDFAIYKFKYSVFDNVIKDPLFEVSIEYKKTNELMYLNYITFNNQFIINKTFGFDVVSVEYEPEETSFYVNFNNIIDRSTVDRKDFKFRYKGKKLMVERVNVIDEKSVKVKLSDWSMPEKIEKSEKMSNFTYRIKNINDISNRKLYDRPKIKGLQFREFFVQEIFENKSSSDTLEFIDKYQPLSNAKQNKLDNENLYWLNSPLKSSRK